MRLSCLLFYLFTVVSMYCTSLRCSFQDAVQQINVDTDDKVTTQDEKRLLPLRWVVMSRSGTGVKCAGCVCTSSPSRMSAGAVEMGLEAIEQHARSASRWRLAVILGAADATPCVLTEQFRHSKSPANRWCWWTNGARWNSIRVSEIAGRRQPYTQPVDTTLLCRVTGRKRSGAGPFLSPGPTCSALYIYIAV